MAEDPTWETFTESLNLPAYGLAARAVSDHGPVDWDVLSAPLRNLTMPSTGAARSALLMELTSVEEFTPFLMVVGGQVKVAHDVKELKELQAAGGQWGVLAGDLRKVAGQHAFPQIHELAGATSRTAHVDDLAADDHPVKAWDDTSTELDGAPQATLVSREPDPAGGAAPRSSTPRRRHR